MPNYELAIKYSNDVYATKKEVADYMRTPMVDSIWQNILEYRSHFTKTTQLKHITGDLYTICLTPSISEKINNIERRMMRLYSQYLRLIVNKNDEIYLRLSYKDILEVVAKNYNLSLDEISLNRILSKNVQAISPELMVVYHYYLALEDIAKNYMVDIDGTTFKKYLNIIQGVDSSLFRTSEIQNVLSKSLINKLYLGIPVSSIEKSMDSLYLFLKNDSFGMFVKAVCALYYVYYVKPMETYSEEISILIFKDILANGGLDELASSLNFEELLSNKEEIEKYILESQKTLDLTYLLMYVISKTEEILSRAFKLIGNAKASEISKEMFEEEIPASSVMPDLSDLDEKVEVKNLSKENPSDHALNLNQNIAINTIPTGLSESEAKVLEEHLLELNPNLSHGQAYFYARHCTVGMSYTISQYKKEVGCAYETARSSMDKLVYLGYYKKEILKNKFIYIPVKKK